MDARSALVVFVFGGLTFCRIAESKCLPGMRAAKKKEKRVYTEKRSPRQGMEGHEQSEAGELRP